MTFNHNTRNNPTTTYGERPQRVFRAPGKPGSMSLGDRIFVRVTSRYGETLLEVMTNRVSTQTELFGEVRRQLQGHSGLVKLWVRNHSRGWSRETPLMLYAPLQPRFAGVPGPGEAGSAGSARMLKPWETH